MNLSNILVAVDFSPTSLAAVERARALAEKDTTIRLVHVVSVTLAPVHSDRHAVERFYESLSERARWQLTDVAQDLRNEGVKVETEVTTGRPADEILSIAARTHAQLIVVGAHARSGLARIALGSVAEEIARRAPVPTLVVRELLEETPGKVARVLVAVDHDAPSREAVRWAADAAAALSVPCEAVHVIEAPVLPHALMSEALPIPHELGPEIATEIKCKIAGEVAKAAGREIPVHFLSGPAAREIVRFACKDDVIVMGTHGRGGMSRLAFGSVATKVCRRAPCPVLLVRPQSSATAAPSETATAQAAR